MRDIEELARIAIDAGLGVHRAFGPGLFESVYEAVLALELSRAGLSVVRQAPISLHYDDVLMGEAFRADLLVGDRLVIEIKSVEQLSPLHSKQLLTYLRLLEQPLGLLMNFGGGTFRGEAEASGEQPWKRLDPLAGQQNPEPPKRGASLITRSLRVLRDLRAFA